MAVKISVLCLEKLRLKSEVVELGFFWLTGVLANLLCAEGNLSSARTPKAPLKGRPRYPPSFIPNNEVKTNIALLPIKDSQKWQDGRQTNQGHKSKTSDKKKEPVLSVFLAANQNPILWCVAHKKESSRG